MNYSQSYKEPLGGWFLFYFRQVKQFYESYFPFWIDRLAQQL